MSLEPIPGNDNKDFWDGAKVSSVEQDKLRTRDYSECDHVFEYQTAGKIMCKRCGLGGQLRKRAKTIRLRDGKDYPILDPSEGDNPSESA